ncbi:uncharacterized protein N7482_005439 [Penicillium canariense]|uniref:Rhodopsin domain-containing protein n=1 Tax=Penicillium canariense TaxID=189055 RepID=A0A9W9LNG2_9EURO|nr:uncharacterized protein N7482_005439 [Penicillium canariense]KAJ5166658.1 hypothetical protein N7482_005439 [Penicillium canariense]
MHLPSSLVQRDSGGGSIDRSVQSWNYACQSLCIIGMTVFFGLRVYTRCFLLNGFGKEDWACVVAWFLGVWYSIIAIIMGHYGGGLHYSDVPIEDRIPFQKTVYITMVMYGPTAYLTKVLLLWIMARVFSPFRKVIILIYGFMALMLAYYIPAVIVKIRICNPIPRFWNSEVDGTCLDETSIILADAVVSCVSDLIILILPMPLTMSLQMSPRKKIRVIAILGAGGLAVAASIIRLILIILTGQSKDATHAFMRINMLGQVVSRVIRTTATIMLTTAIRYSNAEIAIGVICTCLPALSALLKRIYREYSSNKATHESEYKMSSMRNQSKIDRSRKQVSVREAESDEAMLVYHAQRNPTIETTVRGDTEAQKGSRGSPFDGIGITRTVDVSTSVETASH